MAGYKRELWGVPRRLSTTLHKADRFQLFWERFPALTLIGGTPLIPIQGLSVGEKKGEIFAKAEWMNPGGSIKDRPVLRMILEAILSGDLKPGHIILDSSSGNAGIAYAMIGSMMGYRVEIVIPENASEERKKRIQAHGGVLIKTPAVEGYDAAVREGHRLAEMRPDLYYMPDQYANYHNWLAHYETTAVEIWEQMAGSITHFVAGIGTGGTVTGVGRKLKEYNPKIQVVCIKPEAFPGIEGLKPLEGPGDIIPKILDQSVVDRWIDVTSEQAYFLCRRLARCGIFVGLSSGAYLQGALEVARESSTNRVVTIFFGSRRALSKYKALGCWRARSSQRQYG